MNSSLFNLPNTLSLLRAPLALVFFLFSPPIRLIAIIVAMITDVLDGYFARKFAKTTPFGRLLDPLMDKLFVSVVLVLFYQENALSVSQIICLLSRDIGTLIFSIGLYLSPLWPHYKIRPFSAGKISTAMQFCVLTSLTLNIHFDFWVYSLFIFGAAMNFIQLYLYAKNIQKHIWKIAP